MNNKVKGTIFVLIAGILWGIMSIFVNSMKDMGLQSMDIVAVRVWVTATIMLLILTVYNRELLKIKLRDIWCFVGTGIISITMFNFCYFSNITIVQPGIAAVLMYTSPVFVMIMSTMFFKEKLNVFKVIACVMTVVGCGLVSGLMGKAKIPFEGLILGLISGIGYALYSIFGRFATNKGYNSLTVTMYTFLFACIGTAPFTNFGKVAKVVFCSGVEGFAFSVFGAIVISLVPYYLYTKGLTYIDTGKAGIIAAIEVVVAAFIGYGLFDEGFDTAKIIGIVVIISALGMMNIKKRSS